MDNLKFSHYDKLTKSFVFEDEENEKIRKSSQWVLENKPEIANEILEKAPNKQGLVKKQVQVKHPKTGKVMKKN